MAIPKKVYALSAVAATWFTVRYAPHLTVSTSFAWNAAALFAVELLGAFTWGVIVYPLFLSPLRKLPQPKGASVILGHFPRIFKDPTGEPQRDWIESVPNDGVVYYRWWFNEPRILVTNPKALAEVLVQKSYEFIKPSNVRLGLGRLLGVGILLAEGNEHKRQRRALMPAFSFRHIKDLYPVFWAKSTEMTDAIAKAIETDPTNSNVVSIMDWSSRTTLDIIGIAGMGQDFNAIQDPSNELYQTYRSIFSPPRGAQIMQVLSMIFPLWFLRLLPLKRNTEMQDAVATIRRVSHNLIQSKRAKLEKGSRTDVDILSVALESGGFSDEDLINQLMTFLAAGHETTASSMGWAVYLLCKHPETQRTLRNELLNSLPALSDPSAPISSTDIDRLPFLNAVLNECSRVFPPVPLTLREADKDSSIQGHFVPKGTTVVVSPWAINTSRALWGDDAHEFKPERWLGAGRANTGGAESNYAVTTFLHGPRSCIGKDFAKAEFACLVAALVGRFELELEDPDWELKIQGGITSKPKGGLMVKVTPVVAS